MSERPPSPLHRKGRWLQTSWWLRAHGHHARRPAPWPPHPETRALLDCRWIVSLEIRQDLPYSCWAFFKIVEAVQSPLHFRICFFPGGKVKVVQLCPTLCDLMDYTVQNTGVGSLSLLQGIFPIQGSNPALPHHRGILYQLSHKGNLDLHKERNNIRA